ncbi:MAG: hypothetical protein WCG93_01335 [Paludibacter sp.]
MIEETTNGKATITFDGLIMKIQIPSKKNWFMIIFMIAWLGGWLMGELSALREIENEMNSFMLFWLIGWTIGGGFMITGIIWSLLGFEVITIDNQVLQIERQIVNFRVYRKEYELKFLKGLELNPGQASTDLFTQKKPGEFWGMTGGKIKFDYGMKTIKFGIGIDIVEARYLINEIVKKGYYKHID